MQIRCKFPAVRHRRGTSGSGQRAGQLLRVDLRAGAGSARVQRHAQRNQRRKRSGRRIHSARTTAADGHQRIVTQRIGRRCPTHTIGAQDAVADGRPATTHVVSQWRHVLHVT